MTSRAIIARLLNENHGCSAPNENWLPLTVYCLSFPICELELVIVYKGIVLSSFEMENASKSLEELWYFLLRGEVYMRANINNINNVVINEKSQGFG